MKRWAWSVAGLYALAIILLTVPVCIAAFAPEIRWSEPLDAFLSWQYWLWVALMFLGQLALLKVPVRIASRRPVTKGALWPTVLAGGFMAGCLVVGMAFSILEFLFGKHDAGSWPGVAIALGGLLWFIWSFVFFRLSRSTEPPDLISHQCRLLLKGSILELLIAVPTHIVARSRNYCCAGFMTFIGLTMGISVMLFSFGPAVFFLYLDRWKQLHPKTYDPSTY